MPLGVLGRGECTQDRGYTLAPPPIPYICKGTCKVPELRFGTAGAVVIPVPTTPCAGKPARKKHAPKPAAAKTSKPSNAQPTQTIELPGGQGDTFEIDLLHEGE
jgi:hypothetical protein